MQNGCALAKADSGLVAANQSNSGCGQCLGLVPSRLQSAPRHAEDGDSSALLFYLLYRSMNEAPMSTQQRSVVIGDTQRVWARFAGFLFILVLITDLLGMKIVSNSAVHETQLYRFGLCIELLGSVEVVFLAMGLYVALKSVNSDLALLALFFRIIEASGAFLMVNAFDAGPHEPVASASGTNIAAIFFSVGSTIFFYLFWKSKYIPRFLSILGLLASVMVTFVSTGALVWSNCAKTLQAGWLPIALAELLVGLWLLFKGVAKSAESKNAGSTAFGV